MKVFVSTGFTKRSEAEVMNDIARAREWTCRRFSFGTTVVHNYDCEQPNTHKQHMQVWYLGKALETLSTCDIAYFCKGWEEHTGCRVEYEVCKLYKIPMVFED